MVDLYELLRALIWATPWAAYEWLISHQLSRLWSGVGLAVLPPGRAVVVAPAVAAPGCCVGRHVRLIREKAGRSAEWVARAASMERGRLLAFERGEVVISEAEFEAVCGALGVTPAKVALYPCRRVKRVGRRG